MTPILRRNTQASLLLILLVTINPVFSQEMDTNEIGWIQAYSGQVWVTREGSLRPSPIDQVPFPLTKGDALEAKVDSDAIIKLANDVSIILPENSTLLLTDQNSHRLENGRVAYKVKPKRRLIGINVETKAAVIGVKGTEFLAKQLDDVSSVILSKGHIELLPMKEQFIRYKDEQLSEFEAYQKKLLGEYEQYKQDQNKQYKEYLNSISMTGGQSIAIGVDNEVDDIEPSNDDKQLLERLKDL